MGQTDGAGWRGIFQKKELAVQARGVSGLGKEGFKQERTLGKRVAGSRQGQTAR